MLTSSVGEKNCYFDCAISLHFITLRIIIKEGQVFQNVQTLFWTNDLAVVKNIIQNRLHQTQNHASGADCVTKLVYYPFIRRVHTNITSVRNCYLCPLI